MCCSTLGRGCGSNQIYLDTQTHIKTRIKILKNPKSSFFYLCVKNPIRNRSDVVETISAGDVKLVFDSRFRY